MNKNKVSDMAKDFGLTSKDILSVLSTYEDGSKKPSQVLSADEVNLIFEHLTQKHQVKIESIYARKSPSPRLPPPPRRTSRRRITLRTSRETITAITAAAVPSPSRASRASPPSRSRTPSRCSSRASPPPRSSRPPACRKRRSWIPASPPTSTSTSMMRSCRTWPSAAAPAADAATA